MSSLPEVGSFVTAGNSFFCRALTRVSPSAMDSRILQSNGTVNGNYLFNGTAAFRASAMLNGNFYFSGHDTSGSNQWGLYKITPVSLGINEMMLPENAVMVLPNPNNGSFTLQVNDLNAKKIKITFINVLGETLFENSYEDFQNNSLKKINLKNCAKGIYIMKAEVDGRMLTKKIVIE